MWRGVSPPFKQTLSTPFCPTNHFTCSLCLYHSCLILVNKFGTEDTWPIMSYIFFCLCSEGQSFVPSSVHSKWDGKKYGCSCLFTTKPAGTACLSEQYKCSTSLSSWLVLNHAILLYHDSNSFRIHLFKYFVWSGKRRCSVQSSNFVLIDMKSCIHYINIFFLI